MMRAEILDKAKKIVTTGRNAQYGEPEDNFANIAMLWSAYLYKTIESRDVAAMMILLKLARIKGTRVSDDNWVDIAGYAACGGEVEECNGAL